MLDKPPTKFEIMRARRANADLKKKNVSLQKAAARNYWGGVNEANRFPKMYDGNPMADLAR